MIKRSILSWFLPGLQFSIEELPMFFIERKLSLSRKSISRRFNTDLQKASGLALLSVLVGDPASWIGRINFPRRDCLDSIGIADGTTRKLFDAFGMDGMVLPMPVTRYHVETLVHKPMLF